jgi:hypothetical protein
VHAEEHEVLGAPVGFHDLVRDANEGATNVIGGEEDAFAHSDASFATQGEENRFETTRSCRRHKKRASNPRFSGEPVEFLWVCGYAKLCSAVSLSGLTGPVLKV